MQRRLARLVLPALVLVLLVALVPRPAAAEERSTVAHPVWLTGLTSSADFTPAPQPKTLYCYVWIGTDYFSDPAKTNRTGWCTVTCTQAEYGQAEPTFDGGGSCNGTSGPYTLTRTYGCPWPCP